ncbi:UNVERIFIED_CONTAM: hypothetical protein PYX00_006914 [Menopon gallinae]|uniref:Reverse transcriptase domain-containing protein n=1 Tax=Menopon gallinae TaxID=328185 RepID=A0AAW2HH73_9NEOP
MADHPPSQRRKPGVRRRSKIQRRHHPIRGKAAGVDEIRPGKEVKHLEKAYDQVPRGKLWEVLATHGLDGSLLRTVRSLYEDCGCCVRINGVTSESFRVAVGIHQGCMLSPLLFITYMDWLLRRSRSSESFRYGDLEVGHLVYADDLVLLGSTRSELQRALDGLDAACAEAGMRISRGSATSDSAASHRGRWRNSRISRSGSRVTEGQTRRSRPVSAELRQ